MIEKILNAPAKTFFRHGIPQRVNPVRNLVRYFLGTTASKELPCEERRNNDEKK